MFHDVFISQIVGKFPKKIPQEISGNFPTYNPAHNILLILDSITVICGVWWCPVEQVTTQAYIERDNQLKVETHFFATYLPQQK